VPRMIQVTRPLASIALWPASSLAAHDADLAAVLAASPGAVLHAEPAVLEALRRIEALLAPEAPRR